MRRLDPVGRSTQRFVLLELRCGFRHAKRLFAGTFSQTFMFDR
jgi:hypothetical protein